MDIKLGPFGVGVGYGPPEEKCEFSEFEGDDEHVYDNRVRKVRTGPLGTWDPICKRHAEIMERMARARGIEVQWANGARIWPPHWPSVAAFLVWVAIGAMIVLTAMRLAAVAVDWTSR